jgi:hypothetical protein
MRDFLWVKCLFNVGAGMSGTSFLVSYEFHSAVFAGPLRFAW